jgi:hypothetical protein
MISAFSSKNLSYFLRAYLASCVLTVVVSGISAYASVGNVNGFLFVVWYGAWGLSWLITFPVLAITFAFIRKISNREVSCSKA